MKDDPNNESLERAANTVVPALEKMSSPVARIPVRNPDVARTGDQKVRDISPPLPPRPLVADATITTRSRLLPIQIPELQARIAEARTGAGANNAMYGQLLAQLAFINARLDDLEDDFPEPIMQGGGGGVGRWSGIYEAAGIYYDKNGELPPDEDPEPYTQIGGRYFGVRVNNPAQVAWSDSYDDASLLDYQWYYVANKDEEGNYSWSSRTVGDIHVRTT